MQREYRLSSSLKHPKHFLNLREECPSSTPDPHPGYGETQLLYSQLNLPRAGGWGKEQKMGDGEGSENLESQAVPLPTCLK